jgi:hypothetical protein
VVAKRAVLAVEARSAGVIVDLRELHADDDEGEEAQQRGAHPPRAVGRQLHCKSVAI